MTAIVKRDDLSQRTALSKSALTSFDFCQTASWFDIHYRLPLIPAERITYGSAVDAAVEAAIKFLRMEQPVNVANCLEAASEVIARDGVDVSLEEVDDALAGFMVQVAPYYDFRLARTQEHITGELPDLGPVDGHPDVWLADGRIFDVKTGAKEKPDKPSLELGFYALIGSEYDGKPVPAVGYWTWARTKRPHWQILEFPVTDELLRWSVEKAARFVRAKRADEMLNAKAASPINWTMTGGPAWASKCLDCQYAPMCDIAQRGGESDDAA